MRGLRWTQAALIAALLIVALLAAASATRAAELTGMRSWPAPGGTRLVFDFNTEVTPVAPESGTSSQLVVTVPMPGITAGVGLPARLGAADSALVSVLSLFDASGVRFHITLVPGSTFRVSTAAATDEAPFRVIVDILRPGAQAETERRPTPVTSVRKTTRPRLVVIDAGHGGEDAGARGPGPVYEKNVTLAIARRLADALNNVPGLKVMLTRDGDFFIPLRERYKIAEKVKADLFLSIHCNSSRRRGTGSGTEVYFLSLKGATDQADQDLADMENAADIVGGVPSQAEDDVVNVLYEVKRNSMLERSQLLAETLLDRMALDRRVESRGIKQAGFVVLKSVEFPSALVETAFINNPREVRLLKDPLFQSRMANQIAAGVRAYFAKAGITLAAPDSSAGTANGTTGSR
jgi:N-acetylmuramoyl-L-alanine amidase